MQQQDVFALFAAAHRAAQGAARRRPRRPARPGRLHVRHLGRRPRPHLRDPVKVLLTGSAGFIGSRDRPRRSPRRGDEVVRVDLMLPTAHGVDRRAAGHPPRSTSATPAPGPTCSRGVDVVCHQAALVGLGVRRRRPAVVRLAQRPRHRRPAGRDARGRRRPPRARLVDGGVRRGALRLPEHGPQAPGPRTEGDLARRALRQPVPGLRRAAGWDAGRRGRAGSTRAAATPPARSPRSTTRRRGRGRPAAAAVGAALPQRLRPGDAARTRRTPASRRCSAPRSSAARRRGSSRTAARCATSCTSTTSPGPTCWRWTAVASGAAAVASRRTTSAPGRPVSILDVARLVARRRPGSPGHRRATASATSGTSSPRRSGRARDLGFTRRDRAGGGAGARSRPTRSGPDRHQLVSDQVLHQQRDHDLHRRARPPPPLRQARRRQQQPRHERQPDPLHLGLAHPRHVGGEHGQSRPPPTSRRTTRGERRPAASSEPSAGAEGRARR